MVRGLMLGGITFDSATPPSVPKGLRKQWPQPTAWHDPASLPEELHSRVRPVPPYSHLEL